MAADKPQPPISWNLLPPEILDLVLARLPSSDLCRLQSVSRSWLSSLSSPRFRLLCQQLNPRLHSCLFLYNHSVKISSWTASDSLWRHFDLPAFYVRDWAGSRGLVCLRCHLLTRAYIVGNPLTGAWKELPDPIDRSVGKIWALVTDASRNAYRIILLHRTSATLQIYSSELDRWTERPLPQSVVEGIRTPLDWVFSRSASCIGGLVYAVQGESRAVLKFDVKRDIWKRLESGLPEGLIFQVDQQGYLIDTPPKFVEGPKGRILMIGGVVEQEMESIGVVWELDRARKTWKELARAPFQMWKNMLEDAKEYRKSVLLPVRYVGDGELIVVMASGSQRAITFNIRDEEWTWLALPSTANCELTLCFQPPTDFNFIEP